MTNDTRAQSLLAIGPPNCGKTEFALQCLLSGMRAYGSGRACMAVAGRKAADALGNRVIAQLGSSMQSRPVTTLAAVAFRLIEADRSCHGETAPRLLNGAEQEALLRGVLDAHIAHVSSGDSGTCPTCGLLESYFATGAWASMMNERMASSFVAQLRDMLARMNEIGASHRLEEQVIAALGEPTVRTLRLRVQWRLAFALRREYVTAIEAQYAGEFRLDSSRLLVEGMAAVARVRDDDLPRLLVVDDVQDTTLAGLGFLNALRQAGCHLVLVGNPDESVQSFRGSYPEYVIRQMRQWPDLREIRLPADVGSCKVDWLQLPDGAAQGDGAAVRGSDAPSYRELLASRISLSIPSMEAEDRALPDRSGKMPAYAGALPIAALDAQGRLVRDGSVVASLYRSASEEIDDIVWRIKREHLGPSHASAGRNWNDMAVIAHDNATVRAIGERLRREGVPVLYSSVTRPLKDEPFIQGLFAVIELAMFRRRGLLDSSMSLESAGRFVRSRIADIMNSPLVMIGQDDRNGGYPARLDVAESAMNALQSLAEVIDAQQSGESDSGAAADAAEASGDADPESATGAGLAALMNAWRRLCADFAAAKDAESRQTGVSVDNALIDAETAAASPDERSAQPSFGRNAIYLLLACDADAGRQAIRIIHAVCGSRAGREDGHAAAFERVWSIIDDAAKALGSLPSQDPQYALSAAWQAVNVDRRWQKLALRNTAAGRAANDRLDMAMRLFQFAQDSTAAHDILGFIEQVRSMEVEADSLAHVGPVEQAVTLTTPAGAVGRHFQLVWVPSIQQDVWPNLTPRNTMFGTEDLADVMLKGHIEDSSAERASGTLDQRLASVLYAERKSLLVAVTRAQRTVFLSAVHDSEDMRPSEFLYSFVPERYRRLQSDERPEYTEVGNGGRYAGLDADPRGLVTAARVALAVGMTAEDGARSEDADDAASALALLAANGVAPADPAQWSFQPMADDAGRAEAASDDISAAGADGAQTESHEDAADAASIVTLSPSAVDGLWECPVCWLLENRFIGPRVGSVATSFGTIIHATAEQASREGLDLRGHDLQSVIDRLEAIYESLRPDPRSIEAPADRYAAQRNDADAATVLEHIASYFVESNEAEYPGKNAATISVGTLDHADVERQFAAVIGLDDILAAARAVDGLSDITGSELYAIMGSLVGGWPQGMSEALQVRLSGRIDRLETRTLPDGRSQLRIIDYKTGRAPTVPQQFSDLQLVCYQLGLAFPEGGPRGAAALAALPNIAQADLFYVREKDAPAQSHAAESIYQPPLFAAGSLNDALLTPRYFYKQMDKLFASGDVLAPSAPNGVRAEVWKRFVDLRGTQAIWALTMIARVFYAAAASISSTLIAHPQPDHVSHCRCLGQCPACSGQVDTVFEVRQP